MKYLGIDFGTKRIGIAISDDDGSFAFPKTIIPNTHTATQMLLELIQKEGIGGVVIGESAASNEVLNEVAPLARQFAERLGKETTIPIFFEREDFSSVEAHRYQTSAGSRDDSAAAIILQRFLDRKGKQV